MNNLTLHQLKRLQYKQRIDALPPLPPEEVKEDVIFIININNPYYAYLAPRFTPDKVDGLINEFIADAYTGIFFSCRTGLAVAVAAATAYNTPILFKATVEVAKSAIFYGTLFTTSLTTVNISAIVLKPPIIPPFPPFPPDPLTHPAHIDDSPQVVGPFIFVLHNINPPIQPDPVVVPINFVPNVILGDDSIAAGSNTVPRIARPIYTGNPEDFPVYRDFRNEWLDDFFNSLYIYLIFLFIIRCIVLQSLSSF